MTCGSLFSGIGGLDLGLERAGFDIRWQVEIDEFCRKVLEKHWPGVKRYGDIRQLTGAELEPVDLICGGFPCQDLSHAGKRAGIEGSRSGLWFEFARLIGVLRPRYVLIENVPGLLDRRAMPRVVGELARLGYVGVWFCLRASDFGASHLRKRVFIVAHTSDNRYAIRSNSMRRPSGCDVADTSGARPTRRENRGTDSGTARPDSSGGSEPERGSEPLAHPGFSRAGWPEESAEFDECGSSGDDCGTGRTLAHDQSGQQPELPESDSGGPSESSRQVRSVARTGGGMFQRGTSEGSQGCFRTPTAMADSRNRQFQESGREAQERDGAGPAGEVLADADGERLLDDEQPSQGWTAGAIAEYRGDVGDSELTGLEIRDGQREQQLREIAESLTPDLPTFAPSPSDPRWPAILAERPDLAPALPNTFGKHSDSARPRTDTVRGEQPESTEIRRSAEIAAQPAFCRVADGLPDWLQRGMSDRTKRLSRLGNAVVPQVAEWIGRRIIDAQQEMES